MFDICVNPNLLYFENRFNPFISLALVLYLSYLTVLIPLRLFLILFVFQFNQQIILLLPYQILPPSLFLIKMIIHYLQIDHHLFTPLG